MNGVHSISMGEKINPAGKLEERVSMLLKKTDLSKYTHFHLHTREVWSMEEGNVPLTPSRHFELPTRSIKGA